MFGHFCSLDICYHVIHYFSFRVSASFFIIKPWKSKYMIECIHNNDHCLDTINVLRMLFSNFMCRTFLIYTASTQKYISTLEYEFSSAYIASLRASWSSNSSRLDCSSCKLKVVFCLLVCFQIVMNSLGHAVEFIRRKWEIDFKFCRSLLVSLASVFLSCPLVTKSFQMDSDRISYLRAEHFEQNINHFHFTSHSVGL